jgi:hypothetical protein
MPVNKPVGGIYLQAKGAKLSPRSKVLPLPEAVAGLTKGERRKVRKTLRRTGRLDLLKQII